LIDYVRGNADKFDSNSKVGDSKKFYSNSNSLKKFLEERIAILCTPVQVKIKIYVFQ